MSGKGTELGNCFEDFVYIFSKVKFRGRVGICWDTCHLFSSGYDLKEKLDEVIEEFNSKIGINKLWVIHLNDSLFDLGSRRDRHENIGYGKIGYKAIKRIVNHERLSAAIKILETPRKREVYKNEIRKLLK
jgi:deoxyribonuclease-4